ncbi:citrate-Mg2+:H+ or citrate-Ca2+:H+ symporter, CitMHS family [Saccharopolyspora antimicrobica]|uniref:CitMHS family citrate-Mg2+:H+ or citrate-Ca2+:H+ symporter n=1 Tax=Saccharopolyspora antimicrobica TaxID=455193 RepID=A0A1I5DV86_9PSEU|nr:citrate:proton symporter [Saccharopolyspora antimicrobica]RKT84977.1 CitMHS family citrate-Mg2+:H+ or citrate-Ca2+:H+ symporter [Saccharopolyspora antimicrobica]SFO03020.1 citrate-Mg2+:H+ or citrate-Ca2+:H+ symporter, CitMHS family [Saccharopolyspora antimicrobica]
MLAVSGFLTVGVFLALVLSRRVSVLFALTLVPIAAALVSGFGAGLGGMIADGLATVAPVAIMITFAVLYFSLMVDAGLFDPAVARILRWAGGDPMKITVGTALLTLLVALDGDGASTFLITVSALLPIYRRLGMRRVVLAGVVCLAAGVMNMVPWGGPTARAMAALHLDSGRLFLPVLPAMLAGVLWVLVAAYLIGRGERKRLGVVELDVAERPRPTGADRVRFWINALLTVVLVGCLLAQLADLEVLFLLAFLVALLVNRPSWAAQQELLTKHAYNVVLVVAVIFAAGVFTGILTGTGMIGAMAAGLVSVIPDSAAGLLPVGTAIASMPLSLVFTPDAFYYGIVPVLAETSAALGGDPAAIGRAAILGQMTTGFPLSPLTASTFILLGMSGVDLGEHQRFVFRWAFGTTLVMTAVALLTGVL